MMKVTVTHYLNKKLKPTCGVGLYKNEPAYPVYIRISFERKNERIKSRWIHFDATEKEFEEDKRIQEIKDYEASILREVFKIQEDDKFDIGTKLDLYLDELINHYVGWVIQKDEVTECVINFICAKAGLSKSIIFPYLSYKDIIDYSCEDWYELVDKGVFPEPLKNKILYLALLNEFESLNYKDDSLDYEVGNVLNYYEWKNRGGQNSFLNFANSKHIIESSILNEITEIFNKALYDKMHGYSFKMLDMTSRNKPRKKK